MLLFHIAKMVYDEWSCFRPFPKALLYAISNLSKTTRHIDVYVEKQLVGFLGLGSHKSWLSSLLEIVHPWEKTLYQTDTAVTLFIVRKEYKGQGIGSILWNFVPEGYYVCTDNECNLNFYRKRCKLISEKRYDSKVVISLFQKT